MNNIIPKNKSNHADFVTLLSMNSTINYDISQYLDFGLNIIQILMGIIGFGISIKICRAHAIIICITYIFYLFAYIIFSVIMICYCEINEKYFKLIQDINNYQHYLAISNWLYIILANGTINFLIVSIIIINSIQLTYYNSK